MSLYAEYFFTFVIQLNNIFVRKPLLIVFIVLLIDQLIKIYVKTHFFLGEEVHMAGDWAIIHFTENKGMAYGMEFGGEFGKLFLSLRALH